MKKLLNLILLFCLSFWAMGQQLSSPNGELQLDFELKEGVPYYSLSYKNQPVILPSKLGLELKGKPDFTDGSCVRGVIHHGF